MIKWHERDSILARIIKGSAFALLWVTQTQAPPHSARMKRSQSRASVRSTAFRALGLAALLLSCLALPWVVQAQGSVMADRDGDGLIEIDNLAMLHNMRYDLAGGSYKTSTASVGDSSGCPALRCIGYELAQPLDFDTDDDGTWSGDSSQGYSLDENDSMAPYFVVDSAAGGWQPIGDRANPFAAVFDGNGHSIGNLAIRRDQAFVGLFGVIGEGAAIRNLGLVDNLADYTGSSSHENSIGGLVGWQNNGSIAASYATGNVDGGAGDDDWVGGLVGRQSGGSIILSYATGNADGGGGGFDQVGGLMGRQAGGSIILSYARGNADGGGGNRDLVGGLVGLQSDGSITASYATGDADGGGGNTDHVGGLVGLQFDGSITASYATGDADGGSGDKDNAGRLVGDQQNGSIWQSYGFGGLLGGDFTGPDGAPPVSSAAELTATHAGSSWNAAASNTLGAWDFGDSTQVPVLNYADYDGQGMTFSCGQFPPGVCDPATLLPGQADVSAGDSSLVPFGAAATLTGSLRFSRVAISSWHWRQLQGPTVTLRGADRREATFLVPNIMATLVFMLTAIDDEGQQYSDRVTLLTVADLVDEDGDGLIEIHDLTMLHNMRYDLAGGSYKTSTASVGDSSGCPALRCIGYELVQPLDFDTDDDGTWSGGSSEGYSLDENDSMAPYFVVDSAAGGWQPIGDRANPFAAVFDGNGHSIGNLAIRRDQAFVGLFGVIREGAAIRNLGLVDNLADYTGFSFGGISIGGLVGLQEGGSIAASYATGNVDGGGGIHDRVGGLVGRQEGGSIATSYATGNVDGGGGNTNFVGGLVGYQFDGSITASYATGDADGRSGERDRVGGLVGRQNGGSITASYAMGDADGGGGNTDSVGGLVGYQFDGSITASYATGNADGGGGDDDWVGGLVGRQNGGSIILSYARGDADGGSGIEDHVGGLVGYQFDGSITASYATGAADGGGSDDDWVGGLVGYQENGSITASYATGAADGGGGDDDWVGGLVGYQENGSITASYATGAADGGGGDDDWVGGLVGYQENGSITASYATGAADGGVGNTDSVGTLIGFQGGGSMILQSYGFGGLMGGDFTGVDGAPPVSSAAELTATHAGSSWNTAASNTLGAWDFGSDGQSPVLNYADYDGSGSVFHCDHFPPGACGTFLPGQVPPAALKALELSDGVVLHPAFTLATLTYTASVVNDLEFITIATMPAHLNALAEITPADADGTGDGHQVNLTVGENFIAIEVTAADGMNVQMYALILTRAPSTDATLDALELSGGVALRPIFAAAVRSYTASVANDIASITLTAAPTHARASVAITPEDTDGTATGYQVALNVGPNLITIEVTAEDEVTMQMYTLTLTRALSTDATLSTLTLSDGIALDPAFDPVEPAYRVSVANDIASITLTAAPTHARASVAITPADADLTAEGYQLALNVGPNLITIKVTAADGLNVQTYSLTLTRAAAASPDDATLGALELSGGVALRPIFAAAVRSYTASVANDIETITLTVAPTHARASVAITPADADLTAEGYQLALDVGPNLITMEVTAEDGMNVQTYTLTLTRAPPSIDATLDALELSGGVALRPIFAAAVRSYTASVANDIETITLTAVPTHARASVAITPADADLTAEGYQLALDVGSNLITITIEVTAADGDTTQQYTLLTLTLIRRAAADRDGNGLIEIDNPTMLHNMRYNLAGTSYKTTDTNSAGDSSGCPASGCFGYELEQDLDFDTDDDDATWSGNSSEGYSLDRDDSMAPYFKVDSDSAGGWQPIGDNNNPFDTVFDGNSHTISNLAIRRAQATIGLFGAIGEGAAIRNLGLVNNLADYTGSDNGGIRIGGLVGLQDGGMITTSYTTGNADGGNGDAAQVGGLVGTQFSGSITASYAKGDVAGGGNPGGSASVQQGRSISGGYIAGAAAGGDNLGGLVGFQEGGSIRTSYAEGEVAGGDGDDVVGGLVGVQSGTIRASYAEGDASGGAGDDVVGALVGEMTGGHGTGSIIASYATGDADGGGGDNDVVGTLVGKRVGAGRITESITASYSFGQGINGNGEGSPGSAGTPWPEGVDQATDLSAENAGPSWLNGDWDFGTGDQPPAVQYNNRLIPGQRSEEGGGGGGDSGGDGSGGDVSVSDVSGGNGSGGGSLSPWALLAWVLLLIGAACGRRLTRSGRATAAAPPAVRPAASNSARSAGRAGGFCGGGVKGQAAGSRDLTAALGPSPFVRDRAPRRPFG